jgi:hypothetical protein
MSGSIIGRMATAIEKAAFAIIFVSRGYIDSPNCHLEAEYCAAQCSKNKIMIIYVMMESDYTTVSTPESVVGWLGIMIGTSMWYPLYEETQIPELCDTLSAIFGDECKVSDSILNPRASISASISANSSARSSFSGIEQLFTSHHQQQQQQQVVPTPAVGSSMNAIMTLRDNNAALKECYEILTTTSASSDHVQMMKRLEEFGIEEPSYLQYIEENELTQLTSLLKHAPRNKFYRIFLSTHLHNSTTNHPGSTSCSRRGSGIAFTQSENIPATRVSDILPTIQVRPSPVDSQKYTNLLCSPVNGLSVSVVN